MAIRLIVTIIAAPEKGNELAQGYRSRGAEIMNEPGCEQFEVFQSVVNPDKLAILERCATRRLWTRMRNQTACVLRCCPNCGRDGASAKITSTTGRGSAQLNLAKEWPGKKARLTIPSIRL